ncbi:hypothetical protein JXA05_03520 [Candidatus Peregrinibacteria bacterium]|nr:hypothetical protein [Candidatus Peregrinibacteria bacterium]
MEITPRQLINPGVLKLDEKRREAVTRFKEAVARAKFLNSDEKRNWTVLGYLLTGEQLMEAQKLIIGQDLKYMKNIEVVLPKEK